LHFELTSVNSFGHRIYAYLFAFKAFKLAKWIKMAPSSPNQKFLLQYSEARKTSQVLGWIFNEKLDISLFRLHIIAKIKNKLLALHMKMGHTTL
jgi:hypothetical protein